MKSHRWHTPIRPGSHHRPQHIERSEPCPGSGRCCVPGAMCLEPTPRPRIPFPRTTYLGAAPNLGSSTDPVAEDPSHYVGAGQRGDQPERRITKGICGAAKSRTWFADRDAAAAGSTASPPGTGRTHHDRRAGETPPRFTTTVNASGSQLPDFRQKRLTRQWGASVLLRPRHGAGERCAQRDARVRSWPCPAHRTPRPLRPSASSNA